MTSRLAYPEARAGLALASRTGRLPRGEVGPRRAIDRIYDELEVVDLSDEVARVAGGLASRRALRGADAVHLASALAALEPGALLVTWDTSLADAATAEGLAVLA